MQITITATGTPEEVAPFLACLARVPAKDFTPISDEVLTYNVAEAEKKALKATRKRGQTTTEPTEIEQAAPEQSEFVGDILPEKPTAPETIQKCADEFAKQAGENALKRFEELSSDVKKFTEEISTARNAAATGLKEDNAPQITFDQIKDAAVEKALAHGPAIQALIKSCNADKLSNVDPAKYLYLFTELKKLK